MIQDDLAALQEVFGPPQPRDPLPTQLPLLEPTGAHLRDAGVAAAEKAQDKADPVWKELAYAALLRVAERQAWVHRDDVAAECGLSPHHPNAWGAIWMKALRAGVLVDKGRSRKTTDKGKHVHRYPLYYSMRFKVGVPEGDAA